MTETEEERELYALGLQATVIIAIIESLQDKLAEMEKRAGELKASMASKEERKH